MHRTLAQFVRHCGVTRRLAVLVEPDGASPYVEPYEREIADTVFFNGIIAILPEDADVPPGVAASKAAELCASLPEAADGAPVRVVRIPFV